MDKDVTDILFLTMVVSTNCVIIKVKVTVAGKLLRNPCNILQPHSKKQLLSTIYPMVQGETPTLFVILVLKEIISPTTMILKKDFGQG